MKIALIIRHNYERTFITYMSRAVEVIRPDEVYAITDQPFSKTFDKMLRLCKGIEADVFIALDADLYIENPESIIKNLDRDYCDSTVIDKFRGDVPGGLHIYSKSLMEKMTSEDFHLSLDIERVKRPESDFVIKILNKHGIPSYLEENPVGHHDFNQFREDIFYKYAIRGWRTMARECREWFKAWENNNDEDYVVARKGIEWSWENKITNYPNGITKKDILPAFKAFGFQERDKEYYERNNKF